ncbi:MAG: ATP-binding cassette domain-containing protein [Bacteroidales bacterium]|nr:ATP-binding cassette domain-containing protein [Bacteroidales bacterium]
MIKVSNLSFSYGTKRVLSNISMELKGGNIYGLLGENGVGKTTLLTLLCGLKKPQEGSIDTDGRDPFDRQPSLLEEQFYLADEVAPVHNRAERFGRETGSLWASYDHAKFLQILAEFEVDATQRMDAMSAGQLKKTWIAFALACNARNYFMDEPTNGLDIPSKAQFRSAITRYTAEDSVVVISTHQVRDLENIIDPVIILDKEEVLLNASLEEISSKLFFDYGMQINPDALYLERTPGGTIQVYPNSTGEESKVNIEALFNAVHSHKDVVKALFQ